MIQEQAEHPYSFSMVNLIHLLDGWDFAGFGGIMRTARTRRVELIPSMLLGPHWDVCEDLALLAPLRELESLYTVTSIQSLTFGLDLRLTDPITEHPAWQQRFQSLAQLGRRLGCSLFVLGSPGQKKRDPELEDASKHEEKFVENCAGMAALLGPDGVLCLEHNTRQQGAEYGNSLAAMEAIVARLQAAGIDNVGINLDTKCLLQEFGVDLPLATLLSSATLASRIRSIQVSLDFLSRSCAHAQEDARLLARFAAERGIPISLEEFGLLPEQLTPFVIAWHAVLPLH
jgi:hypothetical protein